MRVLARQRQRQILEAVHQRGAVRSGEIARELGVSAATIRLDLQSLAAQGLLAKVHGGATRIGGNPLEELGFAASARLNRREKDAIGARAAALIAPASAIAISAGTTTWSAARYLASIPGLTIVTNSVPVSEVLTRAAGPGHTVILTGGIRTPSDALAGSVAVAAIQSMHFDILLLGVHGMTVRTGFTTPNLLEAETNRAMVAASQKLIVLADHSKWERVGVSSIAALADADVVVSGSGLSPAARSALSAHAGELITVR